MKKILLFVGLIALTLSCSQKQNDSLNTLLVKQLKTSYSEQNWYVPVKIALEGLSVEQSNWKDSTDNHSIAELVSHMAFWNGRVLKVFKGEEVSDLEIDNDTTFKEYTDQEWKDLVHRLDSIQLEWERLTTIATDEQLVQWGEEIASMAAHNAYHAGQIIYIRKRNGWWRKK